MAEKMSVKDQAIVRSHLYEVALNAIVQDGKETEVIADGALIHLGDGQFAKLKISVCDATKFDLGAARADYMEKLAKQAELARKRADAAAEKERKAAEREAAKAAKATKTE
jgi:hypothetical protein